jgi:hypothetical protein
MTSRELDIGSRRAKSFDKSKIPRSTAAARTRIARPVDDNFDSLFMMFSVLQQNIKLFEKYFIS